jgi:hypothetical protein
MYQYFKYREHLKEQGNCDCFLGAHNIQIQKGEKSHELDLIFYNSKDDKIAVLIECTLSCDEERVSKKLKDLADKVHFINDLGIEVNEYFVKNPLTRIDLL